MLLDVRDVISGYGKMLVVKGVSLSVETGQIVTIIGPNGSGKSTLLKTILGLIKPVDGKIFFNGAEITELRADQVVRHGMGYVPQLDNIFPTLTVKENLEMGAYNVSDADFEKELKEIYEIFPILKERRNMRAKSLSGGERQMLALARALVAKPRLLLLDEPSAGLAPTLTDKILEKVVEIRDRGTAILLVEQNARKSLQISDKACVLVMGKKAYEGTGEEILDHKEISRLYLGRRD